MSKKKRDDVMVAIPALDGRCETALMTSLLAMQCLPNVRLGFNVLNGGCYLGHVRNVLATKMLVDSTCDSILFIDSDISFDPRAMESLAILDEEIVGGRFYYRSCNTKIVAGIPRDGEARYNERLFEANWIGGGVMRIRREVLEKMRDDVETYSPVDAGAGNEPDTIYNFFPTGIGRTVMGEDVGFSRLAQKHGFKLWIDMGCMCKHHGSAIYPLEAWK